MPGIAKYRKMFSSISVLDCEMNLGVDLDTFPQNTRDAVSYGMLNSILLMLKNTSKNKKIHFTGGDGKFLSRFFKDCFYDDLLVSSTEMLLNILRYFAIPGIIKPPR